MASTDMEEIASYELIDNPARVMSKRTARKNRITRLERELNILLAAPMDRIDRTILARKKEDVQRQVRFFDTL